jgi:hypothetical protein
MKTPVIFGHNRPPVIENGFARGMIIHQNGINPTVSSLRLERFAEACNCCPDEAIVVAVHYESAPFPRPDSWMASGRTGRLSRTAAFRRRVCQREGQHPLTVYHWFAGIEVDVIRRQHCALSSASVRNIARRRSSF